MLYQLLKIAVRLAMMIFCRKIIINKPEQLKQQGPLLLACNHPNSFLDAVILDALFQRPIWSLARGDVFKSSFIVRLLRKLRMLPVYRVSEGIENLGANYKTFSECKELFSKGEIVLIFSEGRCINEWHLRPLKKGTARLALDSWNAGIPLRVLPIGLNYSSFRRFGKNIIINFGEMIDQTTDNKNQSEGLRMQDFNQRLRKQLEGVVFEIDKNDRETQARLLERKPGIAERFLLLIPSLIGYILHWPLYIPVKNYTIKRTNNNDHYDSILIAILLFSYPLYAILLSSILFFITDCWYTWLLLIILPFTAWAHMRLKPQLDRTE